MATKAAFKVADESLKGVGEEDDDAAEHNGEGEPEDGEIEVGTRVDFLFRCRNVELVESEFVRKPVRYMPGFCKG